MTQTLVWLLSAFFVIGTATNGIGPKKIRESYARWGYPSWFRFVAAVLELLTAILLLLPTASAWGAILGVAIMSATVLTLLHHKETPAAIGPVTILTLLFLLLWTVLIPA